MHQSQLSSVKQAILTKLLSSDGLRYSEAMPSGIANDLYNYHLQHLIKQGYVQKLHDRYCLTNHGKQYVEVVRPMTPQGDITELFRMNVLLILMKQERGQQLVLNQTRKRHPYFNDKGLIGGAIRPGELVEAAYSRILTRETGLTATFHTLGLIRKIRSTPDGELFSDILYHVGFADTHSGELISTNEFGENYWAEYEIAIANERSSVQGGKSIVEVLGRLRVQQRIPFFYQQEQMLVDL